MVSIGPNTQSHNFSHMWNIRDLRGQRPKQPECPNSLMSIINKTPDFSKFGYMVKLAKLDGIYSNLQANFTIFVPSNDAIKGLGDEVFVNMDSSTARHIVLSSTMDRKIPSELIEYSPASYFYTKDNPNRLFITNMSGKTSINTDIDVIHKDIMASNGIIHVINSLIWPEMI